MGYEIAGGLGVRLAAPDREVFVMVGDGSYLMMAQELVTAVAGADQAHRRARPEPRLRVDRRAVRVGRLAALRHAATGSATRASGRLDGDVLPVDLAANAASLGARVERVATIDELRACLADAKSSTEPRPFVIHVEVDPLVPAPDGGAWWDVPVAAVSELDSVRDARATYEAAKRRQRPLI